ncbi:MAG: hypothetical protein AAF564_22135 [Bacteroidota bacterium]
MHVYAPHALHATTMYAVLGQVFDEDGIPRSTAFTVDFTACRHIDGTGLAMLYVLITHLQQQHALVRFEIGTQLPNTLQVQLEWLMDEQTTSDVFKSTAVNGRYWQFHRVPVAGYQDWFVRVFNNWMARKLYTSSLLVEPQTQCLGGLLSNVSQHAGVDHMTVLFSWDEEVNNISFVVADAGPGIPSRVRRIWRTPCSDEVALVKAVENGGQPGQCGPRGEGGLEKLLHAFVDQQIGKVEISSAFGRLRCMMGTGGKVYKFEPAHAYLPGTLIAVHFSTREMQRSSMFNEPAARTSFVFKQV